MTQNGNATILPSSVHMNPDTCFFLAHFFFFICSTGQLCHTRHLSVRGGPARSRSSSRTAQLVATGWGENTCCRAPRPRLLPC